MKNIQKVSILNFHELYKRPILYAKINNNIYKYNFNQILSVLFFHCNIFLLYFLFYMKFLEIS